MPTTSLASAALLLLALSQAASCVLVEACTTELRIAVSPESVTISVGGTVDPSVRLSTCGGSKPVIDEVTWSAEHPAILDVNPVTGRAVGLAPGATTLIGTGRTHGRVALIPVTVGP